MIRRSFVVYAFAAGAALFYSAASAYSQLVHSQPVPARRAPVHSAPAPFHSKDGKFSGWKVTIRGGRPLDRKSVV